MFSLRQTVLIIIKHQTWTRWNEMLLMKEISITIFRTFSSLRKYWKKLLVATMMMMQERHKNTNSLLCRSTPGEQEAIQHCVHIKVIELEIVIAWSVVEWSAATMLPMNIARALKIFTSSSLLQIFYQLIWAACFWQSFDRGLKRSDYQILHQNDSIKIPNYDSNDSEVRCMNRVKCLYNFTTWFH